jgi:hypothetical protein
MLRFRLPQRGAHLTGTQRAQHRPGHQEELMLFDAAHTRAARALYGLCNQLVQLSRSAKEHTCRPLIDKPSGNRKDSTVSRPDTWPSAVGSILCIIACRSDCVSVSSDVVRPTAKVPSPAVLLGPCSVMFGALCVWLHPIVFASEWFT